MITGKLSNGFEVEVNEEIIKTYAFQELVGMTGSPKAEERVYASAKLLPFLIGEDGKRRLVAYVEKQTGEMATSKEINVLTAEIINLAREADKEVKKS